jgi:hypothetical protein
MYIPITSFPLQWWLPCTYNMRFTTLAVYALLPLLSEAQFTAPLISDPAFHLLSAETIVLQQLKTWGVNLTIALDLSGVASVDAVANIQPREEGGSPDKDLTEKVDGDVDVRRSRLRGKGFGLNLADGSESNSKASIPATGKGLLGGLLDTIGSATKLVQPSSNGWGESDNVAKGEQGDQAVSQLGSPSVC